MAVNDAISKGAEEAILLDKNGFISEGSGENLFIVKNSKLNDPNHRLLFEWNYQAKRHHNC